MGFTMATISAVRLLESCEKNLRELVSKAAARGDYAAVIRITSWAKVVRDLAEDAKGEPGADSDYSNRASSQGSAVQPKSSGSSAKLRSPKPPGYPKFYRNGDELIKLGWSKRDRAEYQHKASPGVLTSLVSKLSAIGASGRIFSAENIMPLTNSEGSQVPDYQAYLCLAWLRTEGLVQQHGRQGYTLANGENMSAAVNARRQALPRWRD